MSDSERIDRHCELAEAAEARAAQLRRELKNLEGLDVKKQLLMRSLAVACARARYHRNEASRCLEACFY